jgi:hypothetical protein
MAPKRPQKTPTYELTSPNRHHRLGIKASQPLAVLYAGTLPTYCCKKAYLASQFITLPIHISYILLRIARGTKPRILSCILFIIILQGPMLWLFKYFRRKIRQKNWRFWLKTKLNYAKFWCYDFLNIFDKKFSKKLAFLTQNKAKLWKILIITLVFEKNANFFRQKLSKIAENCDHNIDPWLATASHPV